MPIEETRIESQTENTKEMPNERAEEQRSQSNDNKHETHQLDQTSREATTQLKIKAVATVDCGSIMCCDIGAIRHRHG